MPSSIAGLSLSSTTSIEALAGTLSPRRCRILYQVAWYSRSRRCSAISGPSLAWALVPSISRRRAGRSFSADASLSSDAWASPLSSLEPGAKATLPRSSEPPPATSPPMNLNGA
ncbi:hypothetical protein D9M73_247980 [compost metagenome]